MKEEVGEEDIAAVVSRWTGVPISRMLEAEAKKLVRMEEELNKRVVGQNDAVKKIADTVRRARAGIADPNRPIGSFLFLGPTGVGKTELTKALGEFMFDDDKALIRVDMSEFMERHSVSKLIGAPPGYVGHEEGGNLTETVRHRPYSVILFDEIEKAHPEVFNILLQVLDNGRLTDAKGRTVNFKNTVIILTSNIGAQYIDRMERIGFAHDSGEKAKYEDVKAKVTESLRDYFRPEFLNRLDHIIIFDVLSPEAVEKYCLASNRADCKTSGRKRHHTRCFAGSSRLPRQRRLQPAIRRATTQASYSRQNFDSCCVVYAHPRIESRRHGLGHDEGKRIYFRHQERQEVSLENSRGQKGRRESRKIEKNLLDWNLRNGRVVKCRRL